MRVISTMLPAQPDEFVGGRAAVLMTLDTLVGDKRVVTGLTIGQVHGPHLADIRPSPLGTRVIARCIAHHQLNYPTGVLVVAGVAKIAGAKQRVRQVLAKAPDQALVLFICADDKVYDAAFPALCVDLESMNIGPQ